MHRAKLLLPLVDAAEGDAVTPRLLAAALALQVTRVRTLTPGARVVVLLNKAESDDLTEQAAAAADELFDDIAGGRGQDASARPDRIVAGSLRHDLYRVDRRSAA